jgi:hypothetical protein
MHQMNNSTRTVSAGAKGMCEFSLLGKGNHNIYFIQM